jgi:hypothetical protein
MHNWASTNQHITATSNVGSKSHVRLYMRKSASAARSASEVVRRGGCSLLPTGYSGQTRSEGGVAEHANR